MTDTVYVLHIDRLERMVLAEQQIAATFLAAGAEGMAPPRTMDEAVRAYDLALAARPVPESANARLLRRLGVS